MSLVVVLDWSAESWTSRARAGGLRYWKWRRQHDSRRFFLWWIRVPFSLALLSMNGCVSSLFGISLFSLESQTSLILAELDDRELYFFFEILRQKTRWVASGNKTFLFNYTHTSVAGVAVKEIITGTLCSDIKATHSYQRITSEASALHLGRFNCGIPRWAYVKLVNVVFWLVIEGKIHKQAS